MLLPRPHASVDATFRDGTRTHTNVESGGVMQWRTDQRRLCSALVVALLICAVRVARAQDATCDGTVVNLSCDSVRPSGGVTRCDAGEHVFALDVAGRHGLQALLLDGGDPPAIARLRAGAFTGRQVRVVGSCPANGAIRVEDVVPLG
jgi:hypothetical protein